MDFRQQPTGRNTSPAAPQQQPQSSGRTSVVSQKTNSSLSRGKLAIVGAVVVLALLGLVAYQMLGVGSSVDRSKYQAVFLDNGQVYFGKLQGWGGNAPELTEVYYFQSSDRNTADADEPETNNGSQTLVKLGEEIHKPSDKIILNKDAVLFIENLEDDGQVVEAIKKDKESE